MKAFIFEPLWDSLVDDAITKKLAQAGIEVIIIKEVAPLSKCRELFEGQEERLLCLNPDYVSWKLQNDDYRDIPNLKGVLVASTAFGWIEQDAANEKNIPICNIKDFSTQAVAEWAIAMMFSLARQTPRLIKDGFPLDYDKDFMKYRGMQLKGATAGIIGLGNNGLAIAERCVGLGMNVVYWSRSPKDTSYQWLELNELLKTADVIFPAYAKNKETESLVTEKELESLKTSAIVVDIIELDTIQPKLIDMVEKGNLFGYGFEAKPASFNKYKGNVWAAPAYAWTTYESMYNSIDRLTDNIVLASQGKFPNRVN